MFELTNVPWPWKEPFRPPPMYRAKSGPFGLGGELSELGSQVNGDLALGERNVVNEVSGVRAFDDDAIVALGKVDHLDRRRTYTEAFNVDRILTRRRHLDRSQLRVALGADRRSRDSGQRQAHDSRTHPSTHHSASRLDLGAP